MHHIHDSMTTKRSQWQWLLIRTIIYATTDYVNEKTFLWSLKMSSLCGILSTAYFLAMKCSKQTHKQTNKPVFARKTCWETIFCAQGANDRSHTLKITGAINQKGSVRSSPCDIIYVQNFSDNQGSSISLWIRKPKCVGIQDGRKNLSEFYWGKLKRKWSCQYFPSAGILRFIKLPQR